MHQSFPGMLYLLDEPVAPKTDTWLIKCDLLCLLKLENQAEAVETLTNKAFVSSKRALVSPPTRPLPKLITS